MSTLLETNIAKKKKNIELILNSVAILIFIWFTYHAYYELFISIPQIHIPRITIEPNVFGVKMVSFVLNVPTVTSILNLIVGFIGIYSSTAIYVLKIGSKQKATKIYWIIILVSFITSFISLLYAFNDFMSNAFDGVGQL